MTLTPAQFGVIAAFVRSRSGIVLEPGKEYLVESRLGGLVRTSGVESLADLVREVRLRPDGDLATRVVDAMTTNESSWFRDFRVFEALRRAVLPELVELRRPRRSLTIWSAGGSTGQEAYSLALLIHEHFAELLAWDLRIVATDISASALERARLGCYSQLEVNRGLPALLLARHFTQTGAQFVLDERIRSMVEFRAFNLVEDSWASAPVSDLVLLRNVLIYFDVAERDRVLDRVALRLAPGGLVLLGGAEGGGQLGARLERGQRDDCTFLAHRSAAQPAPPPRLRRPTAALASSPDARARQAGFVVSPNVGERR